MPEHTAPPGSREATRPPRPPRRLRAPLPSEDADADKAGREQAGEEETGPEKAGADKAGRGKAGAEEADREEAAAGKAAVGKAGRGKDEREKAAARAPSGGGAASDDAGTAEARDEAGLPDDNAHRSGVLLRMVVGVSEDILRWVPWERTRYSGLALVVLNAGLMAMVSMFVLLAAFTEAPWYTLLPVAVLWGWVVVGVDHFLIKVTHGMTSRRLVVLVLRLSLSVLIGLVVAEPLLFKIFEPAVHREVRAMRVDDRLAKETSLRACNPVPYKALDAATRARCEAGHRLLSLPDTPAPEAEALQNTLDRQKALRARIDKAMQDIAAAEATVRSECNGDSGPGLTGQVGRGPACKGVEDAARRVDANSRLADYQKEAQSLEGALATANAAKQAAEQTYEARLDQAIAAKLPSPDGKIGILEEWRALERLSAQSGFVLAGQWLLRLLLIMLDCLPVLAKAMMGTTPYDEHLTRRAALAEDLFAFELELERQHHLAGRRVELRRSELDERRHLDRLEEEDHTVRAARDAVLDAQIDARADELRRRTTVPSASNGARPGPLDLAEPQAG
ncbi:DUF4407 domain-containing protein [Actinomadura roseirufa]|uniref:DUF4407 domain-containing protein n=1 Tax=Actinomadura roseirufa TaxID=2094049 RepID=UPI001041194C|nr:DUF4407 domain-containing protein [Actinomadura roseirufa]